jgi:hypothetical protein
MTSPLLVPYEFLTEKEKSSSVQSATEMVRTILYLNYAFEKDVALAAGGTLSRRVDLHNLVVKLTHAFVHIMRRDRSRGFAHGFISCTFVGML